MLSGPELAKLLEQLKREYSPDNDSEHPKKFQNHEQDISLAYLTKASELSFRHPEKNGKPSNG